MLLPPPLIFQEARPLLAQSIALVEQVTPLLKELREGGLVANVEALTSTAAAAAADIQKLQVRFCNHLCLPVCAVCRVLVHALGLQHTV
jgi:hypothetical protein